MKKLYLSNEEFLLLKNILTFIVKFQNKNKIMQNDILCNVLKKFDINF